MSGENGISARPRNPRTRCSWFAISLSAGLALVGPVGAAEAGACSKFVATNGSDGSAGTQAQPYRTAQKLADSLAAGDTGCLRGGTYSGTMNVSSGGTRSAPITITSYPGERATIVGRVWVKDSANFVNVSSLDLDGRNGSNLVGPMINGDDVAFTDNDITNGHTAICISLGATTYGRAYRTVIARNRVHNCGKLPAANLDHGIYVENSTGAQIVDNVFYDNADRGVQLYPDAQGTYVARNVIDGNGEGVLIAGGAEEFGPRATSNSTIENNIITNSTVRHNVESWWGTSLVGQNNVVRNNCIYGGARDSDNHGLAAPDGFTATSNLFVDPLYANRAAKDFRLGSNSECAGLLAGGSAPLPPTTEPSPTTEPPPPRKCKGKGKGRDKKGKGRKRCYTLRIATTTDRARTGRKLVLKGRVSPDPRRVDVRVKRRGRWVRVASRRPRRKRFKVKLRVRKAFSRNGRVRLRASVRGTNASVSLRVRLAR